jgi:hypothetical protein
VPHFSEGLLCMLPASKVKKMLARRFIGSGGERYLKIDER